MYAPNCPSCGAPTSQAPKKPGCPQAPAPAPKQPKPAAKESAKQPAQASAAEKPAERQVQPIVVEEKASCPCRALVDRPLVLVGIIAAVFGIFRLFHK